MRSLLYASLRQRLALSAFISLILILGWLGLLMLSSADGWRDAVKRLEKWNTGQGARCEHLFTKAEGELEAIKRGRCTNVPIINPACKGSCADILNPAHDACRAAEERRKSQLLDLMDTSDCPTILNWWEAGIPVLAPPTHPGTLLEYSLGSEGWKIPEVSVGFAGLTALLLVLWDACRRFLFDGHAGWRRLMLVVSTLTAVLAVGYYLWDEEDPQDALVFGLSIFSSTLLVLIYGRWAYRWVVAGFQRSTTAQGSAAPVLARTPGSAAAAEYVPPESAATLAAEAQEAEPPLQAEEHEEAPRQATFWPRFWSRCIDLPIVWVVGSLFAAFLPTTQAFAAGWGGIVVDLLFGMAVICVVIFAYEAAFVAWFGATPGKMLFGLSVQSIDSRIPTIRESRVRAFGYLRSGLYFTLFLPFLQILGAITAWKRRGGSQPWDMEARTFVRQAPISAVRYVTAAIIAFCLITVMVGTHQVLKEITKKEVRESAALQ